MDNSQKNKWYDHWLLEKIKWGSPGEKVPQSGNRLNAKKYSDAFFKTGGEGSTGGGSPQDPTNKNTPWEPPDFD